MPDHPSWPAELVEKGREAVRETISEVTDLPYMARARDYLFTNEPGEARDEQLARMKEADRRAAESNDAFIDSITTAVLSALSGDADGWIVGHQCSEARSQADALAEALERLLNAFVRMPDAGLSHDDPRYQWFMDTLDERNEARSALALRRRGR